MSRYDTAALLAALLCIAALGLAAATVSAPIDNEQFHRALEERSEPTSSSPFDFRFDADETFSSGSTGTGTWTFSTQCVPFLLTPVFYGLAGLGFVGLFFGIRRRYLTEYALAVVALVLPISIFAHATLTDDCLEEAQSAGFGFPEGMVVNETVEQATRTVNPETSTPLLGLIVVGAFLLLVGAALVTTVRQRNESMEAAREAPEATSSHDLDGVARVAGEAADRIEDSDVDTENAVFEAWRDMTSHLDVPDWRTTTPAEFRAAALDAGMSADDVATLTDLFRAVRYGGAEPTEEREERAIRALRSIEETYGGDAE